MTTLTRARSGEQARSADPLPRRLARVWPRIAPASLLATAFLVSLVGLYALGASLRDRLLTPQQAVTSAGAAADATSLARSLTRFGWSQPEVSADVLLITPAYFRAVGWTPRKELNPRADLIFLVAENIHDGDLPPFESPSLRVSGVASAETARALLMADSPHHRTTAVAFARPAEATAPGGALQLVFARGAGETPSVLTWDAAALQDGTVLRDDTATTATFHLTGAGVLALLAGLLVSMWPCFFQLTVYFIPSLAGVSMAEANGGAPAAARWRVVKMAGAFVAGFVIVYTLAGAAAGWAAQSFDTRSLVETWRRPLTMVAGIAMLALALRQAARARLPLVCKMPVLGRVGGARPGYRTAMLMGLAYATGCATCFGAAVLVGMLVYVGAAGAPLTGALVMFLFSVGMGLPLLLGASLMARVLPLLERFDSGARYLALAGAAMMFAMAVLLLSDRYMGLSNEIVRLVG